MSDALFHPAVADWFKSTFSAPTAVQASAWPAIQRGQHTLLAAPTGSGKTLAAFLAAIDALVREGEVFGLPDETRVLYVSPLKALSNDIHKNLDEPLSGIRERLQALSPLEIRAAVRTGDTPATERARMRRKPPHILVTTPESLFILLTSESGREMLSTVRSVIVDELHAVAPNKRGAHLALSLERLSALCPTPPTRIGISATQKPIDKMVAFLLGSRTEACEIVDTGYVRERDIAIAMPDSALQPVMATEVWAETYDRLARLTEQHNSTLIFVNTRRMAERVARHLGERIGDEYVTAHHGSLAKEHRLEAERRLKAGELKALVATASLELGIDIGDVDLTCQLGSPRGIATFLQRVGRSGHGVGRVPKGRLFPLSRDDLVECTALLDAVRREELDAISLQGPAFDVLSQQVIAEVAAQEWSTDKLYALVCGAWPYRALDRDMFDKLVEMLALGYSTRRGRRGAYLHHDAVNGRLRARRGARLTAMTNGGAIPDQFDYDVVMLPEELSIGSLNEDFAFESLPGDIFQLGNTSYRILKVDAGKVFVEDAKGQPPTIPFWFGEAPGRSDELSVAVSRLREEIGRQLEGGQGAARDWLQSELQLSDAAAAQLVEYLALAKAALGVLPTQTDIVIERFFDEVGDTHLVIHSSFGSRMNRAWGLAIRKRFCRKFNFELQAAALEDSIVLSLGPTHSFPLDEIAGYLRADTVRTVLTQALLDAPMFPTHWRWSVTIALAVRRNRNGKKIPPQFQRSDAEDFLAVVFPDQLACAENLTGDREIPDHPLIRQTIDDCLHDLMDVEGLERLLRRLSAGEVRITARELSSPSPLAQEIIAARPYAFLDDAPAEERRTQAIRSRHLLDTDDAAELAQLDPAAIEQVCAEAWPEVRDADELHDALVLSGFVTEDEACRSSGWEGHLSILIRECRATVASLPAGNRLWVSAERLAEVQKVLPKFSCAPPIQAVVCRATQDTPDHALRELIRSRLETLGPVTVAELAAPLEISEARVAAVLTALEVEGYVMRGRFRSLPEIREEWCERRLLARIHRRTLQDLRKRVEPVSPAAYMRFLFDWHGMTGDRQDGPNAVRCALDKLTGFAAPAGAWESALLPARVNGYLKTYIDQQLTAGEYLWLRPSAATTDKRRTGPIRNTPIMLIPRAQLDVWLSMVTSAGMSASDTLPLSDAAQQVRDILRQQGATFFVDLVTISRLLRTQVEQALAELVAWGLVTSDSFAGLRALITPASKRASFSRPRRRGAPSVDVAGRWDLLEKLYANTASRPRDEKAVLAVAYALLDRYGVVLRAVLQRESRLLPKWRDLVRTFRRLEARGEVRGGRFVSSFTGEQFAWPDAVDTLRKSARATNADSVVIAAADPLNLAGITTPGQRVAIADRNRLLYRSGVPVATYVGGTFEWQGEADAATEWTARNRLIRNDPGVTYIAGSKMLT